MPLSRPIEVLIIDDSLVSQHLLAFIIENDPDLKVVGYASDGASAVKWLKQRLPDVVTMDIVMPKMDGFETTRLIMETTPLPIIIISASYDHSQVEKSFKSIEAGALEILPKPSGPNDPNFGTMSRTITDTIKLVAGMKMVRRRKLPNLSECAPLPKSTLPCSPHSFGEGAKTKNHGIQAVAIGASLGGPPVLAAILSALPDNFPVPIFIVQHISLGFAKGLVDWLNKMTSLNVAMAEHGQQAQPGCVYVAPEDQLMSITTNNVMTLSPCRQGKFSPISHLFESMANVHGSKGVGIILTGMGKDGALELLHMRQKGALTMAQEEKDCTMFGMPKEAIALHAAEKVLSVQEIAQHLVQAAFQPSKI